MEEYATVRPRDQPGGFQHHPDADVQQRAAEHEPSESRAPVPLVDLGHDQQRSERVDAGAEQAEQVGRAPQRHVETEQPMPQIVDRRRQDHERYAPGGKVKAAGADEAQHADRIRPRRPPPRACRLEREQGEGDDESRRHAAVHHEVRRNPEGVPADLQVPLDVPGEPPGAEQLAADQHPGSGAIQRAVAHAHRLDDSFAGRVTTARP